MSANKITHIRPRRGWLDFKLREVWSYRDLLVIFALRDIKLRYRQTLLGPLWLVIQPLALSGVLAVVFGTAIGIPTNGLPPLAFYLVSSIIWSFFSSAVLSNSSVFLSNAQLFSKIYFPRIVVPAANLLSGLVPVTVQLCLTVLVLIWYYQTGKIEAISWTIVFFPAVVAHLMAFSFAFGLCLSASTAKYRDMMHLTGFVVQIWMFVTPVIYPYSSIPEQYRLIVAVANPLAVIIEQARWCFFGRASVGAMPAALSVLATLLMLGVGVSAFQLVERKAADST